MDSREADRTQYIERHEYIRGGARATAEISALIGFTATDDSGAPAVVLREASLHTASILLVFRIRGAVEARMWISAPDGSPFLTSNGTLVFRFEGGGLTRFIRTFFEAVSKRLEGVEFSELERIIRNNGEATVYNVEAERREEKAAPPEATPVERARPSVKEWGHPDQWREFCCFEYIEENSPQTILGQYTFGGAAATIRHGELECQSSMFREHEGGAKTNLLSVFLEPTETAAEGTGEPPRYRYLLTFIDEHDVVMGTGVGKTDRILDYLAEQEWCDSINFKNCCVPMMIGDDVRGAIERFRKKCGRPVCFEDMAGRRPIVRIADFFRERMEDGSRASKEAGEGRYNLIGFSHSRGRVEVVELLREAGAELNVRLLPEIDMTCMEDFMRARLNIMMPNSHYAEFYGQVESAGGGVFRECGPFGVEGTRTWLMKVTEILGAEYSDKAVRVWENRWSLAAERWKKLAGEAEKYRLALVLGPGDALRLSDIEQMGGLPMPAVLEEMGFGLDLLFFDGENADVDEESEVLFAQFNDRGRHGKYTFSEPCELDELFRDGGFHAVYSNFNFDGRLSRNGQTGFSLRDFRMGLEGAVLTLERLVDICRMPFYRRYGKYFSAEKP